MQSYIELIIAMVRTGILGFGGGPSVIPLIRHEAVVKYQWINDDEFGETLAIANALPGPIATKMSAYLGYRLKGVSGAIVATAAHILPTCLAMVALVTLVSVLSSSQIIQNMIGAVTPVIAVLLGLMAYEFGQKTLKGFGMIFGIALFLLAFIGLQVLSIHPGIIVMIFLFYGAFHFKLKNHWNRPNKEKGVSS
ncbi:CHR family chromate ion transporter [Bacillus safensis FO-36b]|uniref:chromate transporter n=1 Tax=Bacillus TaxID=1386 RepID=UPI00045C96EA|nr:MULTISPECIES: chromate transporter [Bacillus]KDE28365.1 CHR family chromate ion transporter [Bacillus safensis FO-36b]MCY1092689.1 chromate transporter [Bacillus safensis]MCY1095129.1 chromate transporter [Bacillus safensis]MDF1459318.1 chromate transporter [Bacillus safensis]MDP4566220.1 chromate transporter [Bacillus safensis]